MNEILKALEIRKLEAEVEELNLRIKYLQKENLQLSVSGLKV